MSDDKEHIGFIDYLRGVAILAVFVSHGVVAPVCAVGRSEWYPRVGPLHLYLSSDPLRLLFAFLIQGWIGVPIFFVISGFCIHLSFQRSRLRSWVEFYMRRFFRIYPPYLLALLFFAFVLPFFKLHFGTVGPGGNLMVNIKALLSHVFMVHRFFGNYDVDGPFWSVALEVRLYLLYPLLILLATRLGWKVAMWIVAGIEGCSRLTLIWDVLRGNPFPFHWYMQSPLYYWFSWAIGAYLAECLLQKEPLPFQRIPLTATILAFTLCDLCPLSYALCFPLASLCTVGIVARWLVRKSKAGTGSSKGVFAEHLRKVGVVSYSLYLLHVPLLYTLYSLLQTLEPRLYVPTRLNLSLLFLLLIPMWCMIVGWSALYHRYVELVSIDIGNRLIRRRRKNIGLPGRLPVNPIGDQAAP